MAIQNTLNYLLLSEYLNPLNLKDIQKMQSKTRVVFEVEYSKFEIKFWDFFVNLKDELYRLNKLDKNGKRSTLKVEIFGGLYETSMIQEVIYKKYPELKSDEFIQQSLAYCACYYYFFDGDFMFSDGDKRYALKDSLPLLKKHNLKTICGGDSGYGMGGLFLSTTPWACENFTDASELRYENFKKLQDEILNEISVFLPQEMSIGECISRVHKSIKERLPSLINDRCRIAISLNNSDAVLLNSFYIDDISKILSSADTNKNLEQILNESDPNGFARIDTRDEKNLGVLIQKLNPENFPLGAFASKHMLIFSQQIAVNEIIKLFNSKKGGVYSVNGPPGTGKTTLLKDVIAGVLISRAIELSKLSHSEIFAKGVKLDEHSIYPDFYPLNENLKGFEIVVSSSNNKAVQNISNELPRLDSVDEYYMKELDYFRIFATMLLSSDDSNCLSSPAWGLISASLGKSANISKFKSSCLFDFEISNRSDEFDEINKLGLIKDCGKGNFKVKGLISYLFDRHEADFNGAKYEFLKALNEVKRLSKEAFDDYESILILSESKKLNLDKNIDEKRSLISQIDERLKNLQEPTRPDLIDLQEVKKEPNHPGFFAKFLRLNSYKKYLIECEKVAKTNELISQTNQKIASQNNAMLDRYGVDLNKFNNESKRLKTELSEHRLSLDKLCLAKQKIENLKLKREEIGTIINLDDRDIRENSSPFMAQNGRKTPLAKARIELFIKALKLHKMAILSNSAKFATNLKLFDDKDLTRLDSKQKLNILQNLFMIVPVVSTTFASMSRFFDRYQVGKDDIGMMLIDEAGQANISNAIGALWRTKTAVIVGDPLQLEPVVTLPSSLNETLLKHTQAKQEFNVATTSLQARADKVQELGAYIGDTWVGSPLVVHRRCDEPMFGVANKTTYDDAMIWGKKQNDGFLDSYGVRSQWIDVGGNFVGNCSKEQLHKADELFQSLNESIDRYNKDIAIHNQTCDENSKKHFLDPKKAIQVITPFTDVVVESRKYNCCANTIHTMQGQEAVIIIFILGGGSAGARAWASAKPNLLNVALTRAKHYIYIIGDRLAWGELRYFSVALNHIRENFEV